jgi:ubiquitin carboxyl-terminal hydrolase 2/21
MDSFADDYIPKVGKCGFRNIGNTCYMNSILQLLLHCKPLISFLIKKKILLADGITEIQKSEFEFFLEKASIENVARNERKRLNLDADTEVSISREDVYNQMVTSITVELAKIVDVLINKGASVITPLSFKQIVDKKASTFRGFSQQDAHEFIIYILDLIIEETGVESEPVINNVPESISKYLELVDECKKRMKISESMDEKKNIIDEINAYKREHKTVITKYNGLKYLIDLYTKKHNPFIFQIQSIIVNNVECTECKNITSTYEHTPILQLYVCETLKESLNQFIKTEVIENYNCSICNKNRTVNKTTSIWRTPSVLFIQLKRFEILSNGRIRKNNTEIDIPLSLDLNPYCDETMETEHKINRLYRLKGYSNHMGNLNGGHYTADCICLVDNKTWYHYDDSNVLRNTNKMIDMSNAYILMYELE